MVWVAGQRLDLYLNKAFEKSGKVQNGLLCHRGAALLKDLATAGIAHGDLQQGNILVLPNGTLKLVDYDGMFVPRMQASGLSAPETGLPAFQHPSRNRGVRYYDGRLDVSFQ